MTSREETIERLKSDLELVKAENNPVKIISALVSLSIETRADIEAIRRDIAQLSNKPNPKIQLPQSLLDSLRATSLRLRGTVGNLQYLLIISTITAIFGGGIGGAVTYYLLTH